MTVMIVQRSSGGMFLTLAKCSTMSSRFFFSSSRRHTRLTCDWSSDVCSSDLVADHHMRVVLRAVDEVPHAVGVALVVPGDGPRTGQGVVDDGDLVVQQVGVG